MFGISLCIAPFCHTAPCHVECEARNISLFAKEIFQHTLKMTKGLDVWVLPQRDKKSKEKKD